MKPGISFAEFMETLRSDLGQPTQAELDALDAIKFELEGEGGQQARERLLRILEKLVMLEERNK